MYFINSLWTHALPQVNPYRSSIIDIVSVSRYMVVGGEPVAVVPPGSPPYYYRYYPVMPLTSEDP